mmetsp:Transcript_14874/g.16577  ORF Transcript_14874/g.16577 Transcript_14874/m.16577 type:complete len:87 (+) Transcript_14874:298-558(+)
MLNTSKPKSKTPRMLNTKKYSHIRHRSIAPSSLLKLEEYKPKDDKKLIGIRRGSQPLLIQKKIKKLQIMNSYLGKISDTLKVPKGI